MKRWTPMGAALLLAAASAQSGEPAPKAKPFDPEQQVGLEHVKQGSPGAERFRTPSNSDVDASLDSSAVESSDGKTVVLFPFTSPVPAPNATTELERIAAQLAAGSGPLEIAGHTSGAGEAKANQHLSEQRAQWVRRYLIEHGVAAERMTAVGYGPSQPRDTNATEKGRRRNRRVEIKRG